VVALYRLVARPEAVAEMEARYRAGGYGYGHAKTALFEAILDRFANSRAEFDRLMAQPEAVHAVLRQGADKARPVAQATLARLRSALGF
jgi:tryptophanyl-tRNA synthetase